MRMRWRDCRFSVTALRLLWGHHYCLRRAERQHDCQGAERLPSSLLSNKLQCRILATAPLDDLQGFSIVRIRSHRISNFRATLGPTRFHTSRGTAVSKPVQEPAGRNMETSGSHTAIDVQGRLYSRTPP
ncbi:uncharacterized protein BJX67DRAFT_30081 [Aspergillus lucknowensis]|uniref:Uncharacterized protein n=1 Tax=Aspergillus lucknowensis TaxID=176173 RepID=A0ABR4LWN2_9EURO